MRLQLLIILMCGAFCVASVQAWDANYDDRLRSLGGPNAVDCGHVIATEKTEAASACAFEKWKANRAFFVRYDTNSMDSFLHLGLAFAGKGKAFRVTWDSAGFDKSMAKSGKLYDDNRILVEPCKVPAKLFLDSFHRVSCK